MKHLTDQTTDATNFWQVLNAIHSVVINNFTDPLPLNGVLRVQSPRIAEQELEFPLETGVPLYPFVLDTVAC